MIEITISGTTGTGKSLYAEALTASARAGDLTVALSDHELFLNDKSKLKNLEKIKCDHKAMNVDLSIIVINDGQRNLRVDFGGAVPYWLARLLFPNLASPAQPTAPSSLP